MYQFICFVVHWPDIIKSPNWAPHPRADASVARGNYIFFEKIEELRWTNFIHHWISFIINSFRGNNLEGNFEGSRALRLWIRWQCKRPCGIANPEKFRLPKIDFASLQDQVPFFKSLPSFFCRAICLNCESILDFWMDSIQFLNILVILPGEVWIYSGLFSTPET